jgi:hypothetical protein
MRAFISAVLTAIALTFSATAAMLFDADLAGFKRTNALRISKSFRNAKTAFLQESPNDIRSTQVAVFEVVD